jgi:hypothetical protein
MEQREYKPRLISNRFTAVIGLVLTGCVMVLSFRTALSQAVHHFRWLLPLDHLLPPWGLWVANAAVYAYLLWACAVFFRALQGKERVLFAGWMPGIFLSPIQGWVSMSFAAAIQYVKAASISVAFVAAVLILLDAPPRDQAPSDGGVSG